MVWINRSVPITTKNTDRLLDLLGGVPSASGERINSQTVFALPAMLQGTRLVSSLVSKTPCHTLKHTDDNGRDRAYDHPAYDLLTLRCNPWQTAYSGMQAWIANAIWQGNGYRLILRDEFGLPEELYNLDSRDVYP